MSTARIVPALAMLALTLSLCACASSTDGISGERAADRIAERAANSKAAMQAAYHFIPAPSPRGAWVVLLPGASGLTIFDDKNHYFRAAATLNAQGYDALVVDYKAAYRAAVNPPDVDTASKIAWVVEQAVAWARSTGKIDSVKPGAVVAWSLGAEGFWPLLADDARVKALNLRAVAAYYPSNEDEAPIKSAIPLLILTGENDDVTEAKGIREMVARAASPNIELHVYPNANHGFDVESIPTPRTVRLLPIVGPSATFGYNADAANRASQELAAFLRARVK